jgi:hypothetical protein
MGSRFCVSSLRRVASGAFKARKRIPADVRVEYQGLYGPAWEVKLTIPAGTTPQRAKALHTEWLADVEGRIATLRGRNGPNGGQDLTQRQSRGAGRGMVSLVHRAAYREPRTAQPLGPAA